MTIPRLTLRTVELRSVSVLLHDPVISQPPKFN